MTQVEVTFETSGYIENPPPDMFPLDVSDSELGGYTDTSVQENSFPAGVLAVVRAGARIDSRARQREGESQLRIEVSLLMEKGQVTTPRQLLALVTDLISTDIQMDDGWVLTDLHDHETAPRP